MPIYEYRCTRCGSITQFLHRSAAADERVSCAKCESPNVEKIFSAPNAITKGAKGPSSCSSCAMDGGGCGGPMPPCGGGACPL